MCSFWLLLLLHGLLLTLFVNTTVSNNEIDDCPKDCFCQLLHWKDLPVIQYSTINRNVDEGSADMMQSYLYTNEVGLIRFDSSRLHYLQWQTRAAVTNVQQ